MNSDKNAENSNTKGSKRFTVSRRDVLKAAWTVPVVMAVAPPTALAAGSGNYGGGHNDGGHNDGGHNDGGHNDGGHGGGGRR